MIVSCAKCVGDCDNYTAKTGTRMRIGIIGDGAIAHYVHEQALAHGHDVVAQLLRPARLQESNANGDGVIKIGAVADFPDDVEHIVDCAGHSALREYGPEILRGGTDLTTVSIGALADEELSLALRAAATEGGSRLHLASGAIGALDCLRAARVGSLDNVTYVGRKPPASWKDSPAEDQLDLDALTSGNHVHFDGSARDAALQYPKNANVAAAVALAGVGFDDTKVQLIADADVTENVHEIHAQGEFGSFSFEIRGKSLAENPKSSALAAMSVVSDLQQAADRIIF